MREQIEGLLSALREEKAQQSTYKTFADHYRVSLQAEFLNGKIEGLSDVIERLEAILASNPPENGSQGLESSAIGISEVKQ